MRLHPCAVVVVTLPSFLWAVDFGELLVDRVKINTPSPLAMTITALWIIATIVAVAVYLYMRQRTAENFDRERSEQIFVDTANEHGLTPSEIERLRRIAAYARGIEPQVVLQSVSVWERCINQYIHEAMTHRPSPGTMERDSASLFTLREKLGFTALPLEHPLASSRNMSIGQGGSLFPRAGHQQILHKVHVSHLSEYSYTLSYDSEEEGSVRLRAGDEVRFAFMRPVDGFYSMPATVLSFDNAGTIELSHTLDFKRNQLRQYVRIDLAAPMKFRLVSTTDEETSQVRRGEVAEARFSDVSGGGCSFIFERQLRPGDIVSISFALPDVTFAGIVGKVLRVSLQEGKTKTLYKHHVQFSDIEPRKRDSIVHFVFEKQRQMNQGR